jgi:elongation factor G
MHVVSAFVPLANLYGYASYLRDATRGRGSFTMQLDRYEPVDDEVK